MTPVAQLKISPGGRSPTASSAAAPSNANSGPSAKRSGVKAKNHGRPRPHCTYRGCLKPVGHLEVGCRRASVLQILAGVSGGDVRRGRVPECKLRERIWPYYVFNGLVEHIPERKLLKRVEPYRLFNQVH